MSPVTLGPSIFSFAGPRHKEEESTISGAAAIPTKSATYNNCAEAASQLFVQEQLSASTTSDLSPPIAQEEPHLPMPAAEGPAQETVVMTRVAFKER